MQHLESRKEIMPVHSMEQLEDVAYDDFPSYDMWQDPRLAHILGAYKERPFTYEEMIKICAAFKKEFINSSIPLWKETGKFPCLRFDPKRYRRATNSTGHLSKFPSSVLANTELKPTKIPEEVMKKNHAKCFEALKANDLHAENLLCTLNIHIVGRFANYPIQPPSVYDEGFFEGEAKRQVYDFVAGTSKHFYDILMDRKPRFKTKFGYPNLYPGLEGLGNEDFGNIICGEVKIPSIKEVLELLKTETVSLSSADNSEREGYPIMLAQTLGNMMLARCLLGILTDSIDYIFLVITSLKRVDSKVIIGLDYYHTKAENKYSTSGNLTPREAMLTLLGVMMDQGPEAYKKRRNDIYRNFTRWIGKPYLDRLFGGKGSDLNFEHFRESKLGEPVHHQLTCKFKKIQYGQDYTSQVISIKAGQFAADLKTQAELSTISEPESVAKVFDANIASLFRNKLKYETVRTNIWGMYSDELDYYGRIQNWNLTHDHRINTPRIFMSGYFSFWSAEEKDSNSYIASGPTIIMEKLKQKPKNMADLRKGAQQLARLAAAGIAHNDIKLDSVFMRGDDFVFVDYGLSKDVQSREEQYLELSDDETLELSEPTLQEHSQESDLSEDLLSDFYDYLEVEWGFEVDESSLKECYFQELRFCEAK